MRTNLAEPSEIIIWSAGGLLAVLLGVGAAFFLWSGFRDAAHIQVAPFLVAGFSTGVLLLGMASKRPLVRTIVALFAVTLVLSFLIGTPSFARLV